MAKVTNEANPALTGSNNKRVRELVESISDLVPEVREMEARETELKQRLRTRLKPFYWAFNRGEALFSAHTFDVPGQNGTLVQVNFVDKYFVNKDRYDALRANIQGLDRWLVASYDIKINPQNLRGQRKAEFLTELRDLCRRYGVNPSVQDYFGFTPVFHEERWELGDDVNQEVDAIVPMEVQITPVYEE